MFVSPVRSHTTLDAGKNKQTCITNDVLGLGDDFRKTECR